MRGFTGLLILLISLSVSAAAQSGRASGENGEVRTGAASDRTVKDLFDEANGYATAKYNEYSAKKVPYSDRLLEQTKREQKQLAAKNAAIASARAELKGDDLYYLGLLHWIAENYEGMAESLSAYVLAADTHAERTQTARSLIVIANAKLNRLDIAERYLAEYYAAGQIALSERLRMESELAKAYQTAGKPDQMAPHAEKAFAASRENLKSSSSRAVAVNLLLDNGMLVFEAYSALGLVPSADTALDQLRAAAVESESPSFYYYVVDKKITYLIETGRKTAGLELYLQARIDASRDFPLKSAATDVLTRLSRRETHYKLLGETAPEFAPYDKWFPGKARTLADLRGKVVLLDFWAMWCGPCFEAFPHIRAWQDQFGRDNLEVIGLTRYYGLEVGAKDNLAEIALLTAFRKDNSLDYDIVVAADQRIQLQYGALALPTAVIIDRKGVVRYIGTGTNSTRIAEMRAMIAKLVAEK